MRNPVLLPFSFVTVAGICMIFVFYQIWDLKRELVRHLPKNTCERFVPEAGNTDRYVCEEIYHMKDSDAEKLILEEKSLQKSKHDNRTETDELTFIEKQVRRKICRRKVNLLILVSSHYSHTERRTAIRSTWGLDGSMYPTWTTLFVLGVGGNKTKMKKARIEQVIFKDSVIGNFNESFYNLTFKVEYGLRWVEQFCEFDYLLKADDDVFVNTRNLLAFLKSSSTPRQNLYAGNVHYAAEVIRKGKYGVTKEEYAKGIYPRYCSGGGFVLSVDVVRLFVSRIKLLPKRKRLKIDDAYIGVLALEVGVDVHPSKDFLMFETSCVYKASAIVFHPVKQMPCMWQMYVHSVNKSI